MYTFRVNKHTSKTFDLREAGGPRPLHETVLEFESSGRWPDDTARADHSLNSPLDFLDLTAGS